MCYLSYKPLQEEERKTRKKKERERKRNKEENKCYKSDSWKPKRRFLHETEDETGLRKKIEDRDRPMRLRQP